MAEQATRAGVGARRRPLWMPAGGSVIGAWVHAPPTGAEPRGGVVVCPPTGYEYTHSYRTLRCLADALARRGFTAVRFDYRGTGVSPGHACTPALVDRWREDVRSAVALARSESGGGPVSVVGLRLGGLLAGVAAAEVELEHWVAWSPVVRGRRYVREVRALAGVAASAGNSTGAGDAPDVTEAGGFPLARATADDLGRLDLLELDYRLRGDVLVVERDDVPAGDRALAAALSERGLPVESLRAEGFAAMMAEPHENVVPDRTVTAIADWLAERSPPFAGSMRPVEPPPAATVAATRWKRDLELREELVVLDTSPSLFGVLTVPPGGGRDGPCLLLANAGSVHQVGPNRVYVELARDLAEAGFPSLRIDLRNLGDSVDGPQADENAPYPATAEDDVVAAAGWLRERGYSRIVVGGICSGAHTAFHAALEGSAEGICAALPINPLTFYWVEGMSTAMPSAHEAILRGSQYRQAARRGDRWARFLTGRAETRLVGEYLVQWARNLAVRTWGDALRALRLRGPGRLSTDLERYPGAGVRLDFVFSRSDPGYAILKHEARSTVARLRRRGGLTVSFVEDADHTFSRSPWREELSRIVAERLRALS